MALITRNHYFTVDMDKPLTRQSCGMLLAEGDTNGDCIYFTMMRNGHELSVSDATATAYFIRQDGNTVLFSGVCASNQVRVTLPQSCYTKEGCFSLAVKIVQSGVTATIAVLDGYIKRTSTEYMIDPEETIPSVDAIIAKIEELERVTEEAKEAANAVNTVTAQVNQNTSAIASLQTQDQNILSGMVDIVSNYGELANRVTTLENNGGGTGTGDSGNGGGSSNVVIDKTLKIEGAAADAKTVGDNVNNLMMYIDGTAEDLTEQIGVNSAAITGLGNRVTTLENSGGTGSGGTCEDGFSPIVTITPISGGHHVAIQDANGVKGFPVMDGETPTVTISNELGKQYVTFETSEQQQTAIISSPVTQVQQITGGHRVTIYDISGTKSFDVMNGANVAGGDGTSGVLIDASLTIENAAADAKATGEKIEEVSGNVSTCVNLVLLNNQKIARITPIMGKNLLVIGDDASVADVWQQELINLGAASYTNHAANKATLKNMVDGTLAGLPALVKSDVADKDGIILFGGLNNISTDRGKVGDELTSATVAGYMQEAINKIYTCLTQASNLDCRVMVVTPYCYGATSTSQDALASDGAGLAQIIEDVANHNGIPVYNAYKNSGINLTTLSKWGKDGTNRKWLNSAGYAHLGKRIAWFVNENIME